MNDRCRIAEETDAYLDSLDATDSDELLEKKEEADRQVETLIACEDIDFLKRLAESEAFREVLADLLNRPYVEQPHSVSVTFLCGIYNLAHNLEKAVLELAVSEVNKKLGIDE